MVRQQKRLLTLLLTLLLISGQMIPTFAQESGEQDSSAQENTATPIRIGSKEFNEQLLLGKMMLMVLQDAGYAVEDKTALGGSRAVRDALVNGEIDIYPEYTGTALFTMVCPLMRCPIHRTELMNWSRASTVPRGWSG